MSCQARRRGVVRRKGIKIRKGLPVGRAVEADEPRRPIGFAASAAAEKDPQPRRALRGELLRHADDGHLITIAPTGSGKGRSGVVPALLTYPGPTLTIDIKGENYQVAARRRREMGHRVVVLDPFHTAVEKSDGLNPFDLFNLPGSEPDCDAELLAEILAGGQTMISKDLFWDVTGKGLLTGLVGYVSEGTSPDERHPGKMLDLLYADDVDYTLAVALDTHKFKTPLFRQELAAYLNHESDKCRPSVRSTAQTFAKCLGSQSVRACLSRTTFDLQAWLRGEPVDVFLIFPPDKLESHRNVLRLLLATLLTTLVRRKTMPESRTLLLLDECAQLGALPHLKTALTLLRGYGVLVWTLWQDLSQMKNLYPSDWETILNNSSVVQVFGMSNGWMAKSSAELLGVAVDRLLRLGKDEQYLMRPGEGSKLTRRVDYLTDREFSGLYDDNPRYPKPGAAPSRARRPDLPCHALSL
ncbi:MAG: type IV secretory system conjugative DNA transfer family protein [Isosphaeraceae bacterium]